MGVIGWQDLDPTRGLIVECYWCLDVLNSISSTSSCVHGIISQPPGDAANIKITRVSSHILSSLPWHLHVSSSGLQILDQGLLTEVARQIANEIIVAQVTHVRVVAIDFHILCVTITMPSINQLAACP
jgi:hypothetical protein